MGRARRMPEEATLRSWYLDEKLPYAEMVERWYQSSGETASTSGMLMKCKTYDWYVPRYLTHKGSPELPWTNIRREHLDMHDPSMLRKESARRQGKAYSPEDDAAIDAYLRGLNEDACVVEYRRDTQAGWWHVPRKKTDAPGTYVRLPKGYKSP